MNRFKKFLASWADRKNTRLESPVRLQALGLLSVALEHKLRAPITFTQVATAVSPLRTGPHSVYCDVVVDAFFYWHGRRGYHGREGAAPLPPRARVHMRLRAQGGQVLTWEPLQFDELVLTNVWGMYDGERGIDGMLWEKLREFSESFNHHRPWGHSVVPANHDQVIWDINAVPERLEGFSTAGWRVRF